MPTSKVIDTAMEWVIPNGRTEAEDHEALREFPDILSALIRQRNILDSHHLDKFLDPKLKDLSDPFLLPEMDAAVVRLLKAIDDKEDVLIFGDYDVDGVTSITVMNDILRAYGLRPQYFVPRRSAEGYGLSAAALARCHDEHASASLWIAVDCGTTAIKEVAELRGLGKDVIIIDHHEASPQGRPDCVALVNPKCGDDHHYLCAAGVCFKVAHALLKRRPLAGYDLKSMLELVSIATVSDIVPMVGENRLLVRHGLRRLPNTTNLGLKALQKAVGLKEVVSSMDIGFRIGPRINAAGRMDQPEMALATLMCEDEAEADDLAKLLDDYNRERQAMEERSRNEALMMLASLPDFPVIVLASRAWHPGIVGIVASRLMRQFHKPCFIISVDENGVGKGSGRSIPGVSLVAAIELSRHSLVSGGGHEMAAGISVLESKVEKFRDQLADYVMSHTTVEQRTPKLMLDAELPFDILSLDFLHSYKLLEPFGSGNPQPIFFSKSIYLSRPPMQVKNKHLKLFMRQGHAGLKEQSAIYFNGGEKKLPDPPWDIAFTIDKNTFRGVTSLQMIIQDIRAGQS